MVENDPNFRYVIHLFSIFYFHCKRPDHMFYESKLVMEVVCTDDQHCEKNCSKSLMRLWKYHKKLKPWRHSSRILRPVPYLQV